MALTRADAAAIKFCEADLTVDSSTDASSADDNRSASDVKTESATNNRQPMKVRIRQETAKATLPSYQGLRNPSNFSVRNTFVHVDDGCTIPLTDRQQRSSTEPAALAAALDNLSDSEDEDDKSCGAAQSDDEEEMPTVCKTKTQNSFEGTPHNLAQLAAFQQQQMMALMIQTFVPPQFAVWPNMPVGMPCPENPQPSGSNNPPAAEVRRERAESGGSSHPLDVAKERKSHQAKRPIAARKAERPPQIAQQSDSFHAPADPNDTTVVLRNLPLNYKRSMLVKMIDYEGFAGEYDFLYLPVDFDTGAGLGYAFVNLTSPEVVPRFWRAFEGYTRWMFRSAKVCSVSWSVPHQGLAVHMKRFRNSPLMHESVPDEYRPMLFQGGVRVNFPPPTRQLWAPNGNKGSNGSRNHFQK